MDAKVTLEIEYIDVDTQAWVDERTGGPIEDLTQRFGEFDAEAHELHRWMVIPPTQLEKLGLFITARAGKDWRAADSAIISADAGPGIVNLSQVVTIYRYDDPDHGPIAFITELHGVHIGDSRAYADTVTDSAYWYGVEVQICCPNRHGWTYRSGELLDQNGGSCTVASVFPDANVITHTKGAPQIICPQCQVPCTLQLPSL